MQQMIIMDKKIIFSAILFLGSAGVLLSQVKLSPSAVKKYDKAVSLLWQGTSVFKEKIITGQVPAGSDAADLYILKTGSDILGYAFFGETRGRSEEFSYVVFFKPDLSVKSVQLLDYRESYGSEIGSPRWLRQFENKKDGEGIEFGKDIKNISGATISAKAITAGVKRLTARMAELKRQGVLK